MAVKVHFQFLGKFAIFADGQPCITAFGGKQIAVLKTLVLQREKGLAFDRLSEELNMNGVNPRNALKTLISRTRAKLNAISDGLGAVIASQKGMYFFKDVPGVTVDLLEILEVLEQLGTNPEPAQVMDLTERLLSLYKEELEGEYWLHMEYLNAVYHYIDMLRSRKDYDTILRVCRCAMAVDALDEHLHILYLDTLISLEQTGEAWQEYEKLTRLTRDYYCTEQSDELKNCYMRLTGTFGTLPGVPQSRA